MGLLEGVVKRMTNRLQTEIGDVIAELIASGVEFHLQDELATLEDSEEESLELLNDNSGDEPIVMSEDDDELADGITYRGRPTWS